MEMKSEKILEYCLSKSGAYLEYPFGDIPICVKVDGKIFAELYVNPTDYKITLRCEAMLADFYRQQYPGTIVRGYHCPPVQQPYKKTIYLEEFDENLLLDMIDHSYSQVIAKMTKKQRFNVIGAIDKQELVDKGAIYFERIEEGFRQYENKVLEGNKVELKNSVHSLWLENGEDGAYVDWYYGTLRPEEKERIRSVLSAASRNILSRYEAWTDLMFLPLDQELFDLTMELNHTEALFCTYYFCKLPYTVWGNYDNKYQCFFRLKTI